MMDKQTKKRLINIIAHQYQPEKNRESMDSNVMSSRLEKPVALGQLWEVDDRENHAMAFVSEVPEEDRRIVRVIPVGDYDNSYDSRDLVIFPTGSPTGFPLIVYKEFEMTIPVRLLSVPYGSFDGQTVSSIRSFIGEFDPNDDDEVSLIDRLNIQDQFEQWHALCSRLPESHDASEDGSAVNQDIKDYVDALHNVLNLSPAQCLAVRRGTLPLNAEQESLMAKAGFGRHPWAKGSLPKTFVELSEQPRWRFVVDDYLERNRECGLLFDAETNAREDLAHQAFSLAARTNGSGDEAINGLLRKAADSMMKSQRGRQ